MPRSLLINQRDLDFVILILSHCKAPCPLFITNNAQQIDSPWNLTIFPKIMTPKVVICLARRFPVCYPAPCSQHLPLAYGLLNYHCDLQTLFKNTLQHRNACNSNSTYCSYPIILYCVRCTIHSAHCQNMSRLFLLFVKCLSCNITFPPCCYF